jgi:hypothetical protein
MEHLKKNASGHLIKGDSGHLLKNCLRCTPRFTGTSQCFCPVYRVTISGFPSGWDAGNGVWDVAWRDNSVCEVVPEPCYFQVASPSTCTLCEAVHDVCYPEYQERFRVILLALFGSYSVIVKDCPRWVTANGSFFATRPIVGGILGAYTPQGPPGQECNGDGQWLNCGSTEWGHAGGVDWTTDCSMVSVVVSRVP